MDQLPAIARVFAYLSFLTIGGGMAAFPEMKVQLIDIHHWQTYEQLIHIYSVGQLAPGPNMMMVAAFGERVAGIAGAVVAASAFFGPTALITFAVGRIWKRIANWPWRASIQKALGPVAIGLAVAGLITFGKGALTGPLLLIVAVLAFVLSNRTKINPALLILAGAIVGGVALL